MVQAQFHDVIDTGKGDEFRVTVIQLFQVDGAASQMRVGVEAQQQLIDSVVEGPLESSTRVDAWVKVSR